MLKSTSTNAAVFGTIKTAITDEAVDDCILCGIAFPTVWVDRVQTGGFKKVFAKKLIVTLPKLVLETEEIQDEQRPEDESSVAVPLLLILHDFNFLELGFLHFKNIKRQK